MGHVIGRALQPWRTTKTLWSLAHAVLDLPLGFIALLPMLPLIVMTFGFVFTFPLQPLALAPILLALGYAHGVAIVERTRLAAFHGIELTDPVARVEPGPWFGRLRQRVVSASRWKGVAYCLLRFPLALITSGVLIALWCASLLLVTLPLYISALPDQMARLPFFEVTPGAGLVIATIAGLLGVVLVAPWATHAVGALDVAVGRGFLGPDVTEELTAKAARAETNRAAAVDAAEAERRRIERDLHDGAQQRLVSLALDLGVARHALDTDPERGRELVEKAHEEAKAALKELRDLVRGIHPVILEDRGLDAALSAVVARCPVPVTLQVDLVRRPPAAVESAAYFVVSEALTNVANHSGAKLAHVAIAPRGSRLLIEVRDDGVGGADPSRGTGLAGLRERVEGMGGTIDILSPTGGPTTLSVELPCAS